MTTLVICSVKDTAADAFAPPIFLPHANIARRSFQQEVNRQHEGNMVYHHPSDFILYELGTFDDSTGRIECHENPRLVVRAIDLKDRAE